jgi:3-isopropylmalate/(R)-2-methylmalate dehydratase large subunit
VHARDIGFRLATLLSNGTLEADLDYRVLEYAGDLDQFDLAARTALCSSPTEVRAYGVFLPPSEAILAHAKAVAKRAFEPVYADLDARYEAELELDVSALEPQVALPGGVQNAVDVTEAAGTRVDHAFLGSCGSGMYQDFETAGAFLKGRRIAPHVRLFVAPGSEASTQRMVREGLMQLFIEAGAVMLPAGCGPCNDAVIGPVHSGEVSISTAANNNFGRFGAKDAQLYLGSPATVAASAVAGKITDPREIATHNA